MLHEGKILYEGRPEDIQENPDPIMTQFISGLETRHDSLTGLLPQPRGESRFKEEMARLHRHQTAFSLIVFRVKDLDDIHEKAGHVAGQTILKNFSVELKKYLRITDICFRYGLNKIIAVLPNTDLDQARMTCSKLAKDIKIDEIAGHIPHPDLDCVINVGFAEAKKDLQFEHLLKEAESKLDDVCFHK
jgi:phospholipid/cholesterol/gamma-HCH transport system ATP-binding protein